MRGVNSKGAKRRTVLIAVLLVSAVIAVFLSGCGSTNLWNVSLQPNFNELAISTQAQTTPKVDLSATVPDNANTQIVVTLTQTGTAQTGCNPACASGLSCWNGNCYDPTLT